MKRTFIRADAGDDTCVSCSVSMLLGHSDYDRSLHAELQKGSCYGTIIYDYLKDSVGEDYIIRGHTCFGHIDAGFEYLLLVPGTSKYFHMVFLDATHPDSDNWIIYDNGNSGIKKVNDTDITTWCIAFKIDPEWKCRR